MPSALLPGAAQRVAAFAAHAPLLPFLVPGGPVALVLVIVGVMVVLVTRIPSVVAAWQARRMAPVGQVALEEGWPGSPARAWSRLSSTSWADRRPGPRFRERLAGRLLDG